jgi:amino acid transporter
MDQPRRFNLLQASALNMANMIGIGPFITIPALMTFMGGPQAMLGWALAFLVTLPDGMIWAELGAALPGHGGTYLYLLEGFGRRTWGRLMAFLFVWQLIFSGPLEIASGYIGFAKYCGYFWKDVSPLQIGLLGAAMGVVNLVLVYRRITALARITVALWVGTLLTTAMVIFAGMTHFDPAVAFDFPPDAFHFSWGFMVGLGGAARIGVYDYLGYYDVCYIGEEVENPGRVIPRSILISLVGVAAIYLAINLSIIGVVPWREFVPADAEHPAANFVVSVMMERVFGAEFSRFFTLMVLWTTVGSVFALLLGYSRTLYAAARDGLFFAPFARLHAGGFPALSVLVLGVISIGCSFLSLDVVIGALLTMRILVQFVGQIVAVILLRRLRPELPRPYRIWMYPLPCAIALAGWLFLFVTSEGPLLLAGGAALLLGLGAYALWSRVRPAS